MKKTRIVILASGGGGHLAFLHRAIKNDFLDSYVISKVIAPNVCGATLYAEQNMIPVEIVDFNNPKSLSVSIEAALPGLVISNVNKIIPSAVLNNSNCEFVNLHYSLLPSFKGFQGIETLRRAIDYGVVISGATVHKVSAELDGGTPLSQAAFTLAPNCSAEQQMHSMFIAGCISLFAYLRGQKTEPDSTFIDLIRFRGINYLIGPSAPFPILTSENKSILFGS